MTFELDLKPSPYKNVRVQKFNLEQFQRDKDKSKEPWETWLTPPVEVLPAKMPAELAARFLGFRPEHIPVLMKLNLLDPLGEPVSNAQKFFFKPYIVTLASDVAWMNKATQAIYEHWEDKNERKTAKKNERKNLNPAPVALVA